MVISEFALVKISVRNKTNYQQLGYDCNVGDIIEVPICHLSKASASLISIQCDYCNEPFDTRYADYVANKKRTVVDKDCCRNCQPLKAKEVAMVKYGVPHTSHLEDVKKKRSASLMEHYGVDNASKAEEVKEKKRQTCFEHYGVDNYTKTDMYKQQVIETSMERYGVPTPTQTPEVKAKRKQTCLEKYGTEHASQSEIVKEKIRQTNLEKYGCECVFSNNEIKEKIKNTMYQNGNVPTSRQQLEIFQMLSQEGYDVKLNYPVDKYSLDVALFYCGLKIDIEYDGWYWHQDKHKDAVRNGVLINNFGWKVIRVKGGNLLPDIMELKNAIEIVAKTNLDLYSIKLDDWKEINNNESEEI